MTARKQNELMVKALASCMRLFVIIREGLIANNDNSSPLFESVSSHANMCGTLIPDDQRLTPEELAAIRYQLRHPAPSKLAEEEAAKKSKEQIELSNPAELQKRLAAGNVIVLKPGPDGKLREEGPGLPGFAGKPFTQQPH